MRKLISIIGCTRDWQAATLVLLIATVVCWELLMPISRTVQRATLQRFHLASPDFFTWAIQQPVPAMYNFENRVWVSPEPLSNKDLQLSISEARKDGVRTKMLNHFPARQMTFGDGRYETLNDAETRFLYMRSHYRDEVLATVLIAEPNSNGGFSVRRRSWSDE